MLENTKRLTTREMQKRSPDSIPMMLTTFDQDGAEVKGRDAMQKLLADNFVQNPGAKLSITTKEVKQLTPDVKVTRGIATVTPANGAAETTRYTAVKVRKGDH